MLSDICRNRLRHREAAQESPLDSTAVAPVAADTDFPLIVPQAAISEWCIHPRKTPPVRSEKLGHGRRSASRLEKGAQESFRDFVAVFLEVLRGPLRSCMQNPALAG